MIWLTSTLSLILAALLVTLYLRYQKLQTHCQQQQRTTIYIKKQLEDSNNKAASLQALTKARDILSKNAIVFIDVNQQVLTCNHKAELVFGPCSPGSTLMGWTKYHDLSDIATQTLVTPGLVSQQFNHQDVIFEVRAVVVDSDPMPIGILMMLRDVSELQRLGRARRDLVANISHDLRTPISGIQLVAETLQNGALKNTRLAREMIDRILEETDTLEQINQELMDLSLIESGRMPLKLVSLNLIKRIKKETKRLKSQANRKKLGLVIDIPAPIQVLADKGMLSRVLVNLIHNAIKFTNQGQITVQAQYKPGDEMVTISVADTGIGISQEDQPRIFERFYKRDEVRHSAVEEVGKTVKTGSGLGLAIVRHIVEAHGGQIWVESVLGYGSTFFFTLPPEAALFDNISSKDSTFDKTPVVNKN